MGRIIANQEELVQWVGFIDSAALKELDSIASLEFQKLKDTSFEDSKLPTFTSRKKFYFQLSDSRLFETDTAEEAIIESQLSNEKVTSIQLSIDEGIINTNMHIYYQNTIASSVIKIKCEPQDNEHAARVFNQMLFWSKKQVAPKYIFVLKSCSVFSVMVLFFVFIALITEIANFYVSQPTPYSPTGYAVFISIVSLFGIYLTKLLTTPVTGFEVGKGVTTMSSNKRRVRFYFETAPKAIAGFLIAALLIAPFREYLSNRIYTIFFKG